MTPKHDVEIIGPFGLFGLMMLPLFLVGAVAVAITQPLYMLTQVLMALVVACLLRVWAS